MTEHKRGERYSEEVKLKIRELFEINGFTVVEITRISKDLFGFMVPRRSVYNILYQVNINAKANTDYKNHNKLREMIKNQYPLLEEGVINSIIYTKRYEFLGDQILIK